jgi:hypothetical protein
MFDAFAKNQGMAKQKFRPTRLGGFSGSKAYIYYVEILKKRRNAVGRTFCDAIMFPILGDGRHGVLDRHQERGCGSRLWEGGWKEGENFCYSQMLINELQALKSGIEPGI